MSDLAQQIRERLDALAAPPLPAAFIEVSGVPDEDLEAWEKVFDEVAEKALPLRLLPPGPKWTPLPDPRSAALLAVVELHKPVRGIGYGSSEPGGYRPLEPACAECGKVDEYAVPWPCQQLRLIAEQLGIEVDRG